MLIGHGSPNRQSRLLFPFALLIVALAIALPTAKNLRADDISIRARITWGGGTAKTWHCRAWIENGRLANKTLLSLNAKSPGSCWITEDSLQIRSVQASNYGAVDVDLTGDRQESLHIEFRAIETGESVVRSFRLEELLFQSRGELIDGQNNRVHVARVPGDRLRINVERDSMVFRAGQDFRFTLLPVHTGVPAGSTALIRIQRFTQGNSESDWSSEYNCQSDSSGKIAVPEPFAVPVSHHEGAHHLLVELIQPAATFSFSSEKVIASRKVEYVVVPLKRTRNDANQTGNELATWKTHQEIDPTQSSWWQTVQEHVPIGRLAGYPSDSYDNQRSKINGGWLEIAPGGWNAFPLSTHQVGKPHLLEIEYGADQQMLTGISIVDRDQLGAVPLFGADSGVIGAKNPYLIHAKQDNRAEQNDTNATRIHRFVFWPNRNDPFLLIANHDKTNGARIGKIRVLAGPDQLPEQKSRPVSPQVNPLNAQSAKRQVWAYYENPLFPENFGAQPSIDPVFNQSMDDWNMFFNGTDRFVQLLKSHGYTGAMVTVSCESSAIYPSQLLEATPKYDSGLFFSDGRDVQRKDVLKLMFEIFDQQGLTLVPTLEFSGPLPSLERTKRENPAQANGIDLRHVHGHLLEDDPNYSQQLAASYNPLHPQVQKAIRDVVAEIVERYGHHRSFGGVSVKIGAGSYLTLPSQLWGYDASTVRRFIHESGIKAPHQLFAAETTMDQVANWLLENHQLQWTQWRTRKVSELFRNLASSISSVQSNAKLVIAAVDLYKSDEARLAISPSLRWSPDFAAFQRQMGIDRKELESIPGIRWLDSQSHLSGWTQSESRIASNASLSSPAKKFAAQFRNSGDLSVNRILWSEFDRLPGSNSTNGQPVIHAQLMSEDHRFQNRTLSSRLAIKDSQLLVEGGKLMPLGQSSARKRFFQSYQQLPAVQFVDVPSLTGAKGGQSVVVRQQQFDSKLYFYAVNQSPWYSAIELRFSGNNDAAFIRSLSDQNFSPSQNGDEIILNLELEPFEMVAGFAHSSMKIKNWEENISSPEENSDVQTILRNKSDRLLGLIQQAQRAKPVSRFKNADFEASDISGMPSDWLFGRQTHEQISTNHEIGYLSTKSLSMKSSGTPTWIRSQRFNAPETGRLSIEVWIRANQVGVQPALRLAIEAKHFGKEYYRFAGVGSLAGDSGASPINDQWQKYVVHFDDLPTEGLSQIQIGFDLMSRGDVMIDQVAVYDRWFDESDARAMTQRVALARHLIDEGRCENARQILDGYWFKFLETYVSEQNSQPDQADPIEVEASSPRLLDRMRGIVPRRFFRFR